VNIFKSSFIIGSALMIATSVNAEGRSDHGGREGVRAQAEKHVNMTRDVAFEKAAAHFDKVDTDGDGVLSADERKVARDAMGERGHKGKDGERRAHKGAFKVFDKDGSGDITTDEFAQASAEFYKGKGEVDADKVSERFASIDKDADGKITQSEMQEAGKGRMERKEK
jgi:hypothetical protein